MNKLIGCFIIILAMYSCDSGENRETGRDDTVTNGVINAEGEENNAYNLPGEDIAAIHQNTTNPGVLNKDAADTQR